MIPPSSIEDLQQKANDERRKTHAFGNICRRHRRRRHCRRSSNAKLGIVKPGGLKRACAKGFSKTQGHRSDTCYRTFARVCLPGKIKGTPKIVKTGPNSYRVPHNCFNQPH